jgi:phosphoribosylaminoimidazole-succinocarboxamide synthase
LNTFPPAVHETQLQGLTRVHRGKVRDVYAIDAERLLIVATDRISAFDVVLPIRLPQGQDPEHDLNFWFAHRASSAITC